MKDNKSNPFSFQETYVHSNDKELANNLQNKSTRGKWRNVQSKYKTITSTRSLPKREITLEKIILDHVSQEFGAKYPKSYEHLKFFMDMGIVNRDKNERK
jgi:hypothetical protein